ncbi:MAG: hypothetical protein AVDCRST_MAG41-2804, partial [uncultured Corynebacteriales bacterium]
VDRQAEVRPPGGQGLRRRLRREPGGRGRRPGRRGHRDHRGRRHPGRPGRPGHRDVLHRQAEL